MIREDIIKTFNLLSHQTPLEMRVLQYHPNKGIIGRKLIQTPDELVEFCATFDGKGNIYVGLRERLEGFQLPQGGGAEKKDISAIPVVVIDIDPVRRFTQQEIDADKRLQELLEKEQNQTITDEEQKELKKKRGDLQQQASTDEELGWALAEGEYQQQRFVELGFNPPIRAMSGNGCQLWFPIPRIELGDEGWYEEKPGKWTHAIELYLKAFEDEIREAIHPDSHDKVALDSIYDLARIIKVIGTLSIKGTPTSERPHRESYWIDEPIRNEDAKLREHILNLPLTPEKQKPKPVPLCGTSPQQVSAGGSVSSAQAKTSVDNLIASTAKLFTMWQETDENDRSSYDYAFALALLEEAHKASRPCGQSELEDALRRKPGGKYERDRRDDYVQLTAEKAIKNFTSPTTRKQAEHPAAAPATEESDSDLGLTQFHRTDAGNGELITALYGTDLRYDHTQKRWFLWDNVRWAKDRDEEITRRALQMARLRLKVAFGIPNDDIRKAEVKWAMASESHQRIKAALAMASTEKPIATAGDEWDRDKWLLGVANGVVDLRTGEFREARKKDYITLSTGVEYDPRATCPRFNEFLSEVFNSDKGLIDYIQRAVGYSLTGFVQEHCLFLCYGTGRNGKSVLLNTISAVLGDYAAGTPFSTFEMNYATSTNDLAALRGKRFVSARETQEARRLNEARVKAVTGGDPITSRFLYAEFFTYYPQFKVWLAVNHKPIIRDTSEGMWSRVRLIPFTVSFWGREDKTLDEKLNQELSGILNWAIEGCLKWQNMGLAEPKPVVEATEEYRAESDQVAMFLEDCTVETPNATCRTKELYERYVAWCEANGERELSANAFGRKITEKGIVREHGKNGDFYAGVGILLG